MHLKLATAFLMMLTAVCAAGAGSLPVPYQVDIPTANVTLHAQLFKPDGDGPFPTVIALHGCGGLTGHSEPVLPRYRDWAEQLLKNGRAVLLPDSYGSRGLGPQCRAAERKVRARRERVEDIMAARQWLMQQSWVARERISLIGWAHGASALLWAVRPQLSSRGTEPDFRSAVAFYPSCRRLRETAWSARVPTLILIGSADDWTPASACQQMVAGARGRSARAEIVVYPGAYHEFDRANAPIRLRTGLVNTVDPSGRAHGGTNPAARSDALKRVPQWLEK